MKPALKERFWSSGVIAVMTLVLVALAVLQYRWSGEISDATMVRMRQNLQSSVSSFREDFTRELSATGRSLQPPHSLNTPTELHDYAIQVANWRRTANHPWLIDGVYVWKRSPEGRWQSWKLDAAKNQFVQAENPAKLARLQLSLEAMTGNHFFARGFPPRDDRGPGPAHPEHERFEGPPSPPWLMVDAIPALVGMVPMRSEEPGPNGGRDCVVLQLSETAIQQHILPELTDRYFGVTSESSYHVIVAASDVGPILYSSAVKNADQDPLQNADANVSLLGPMGPFGRQEGGRGERRGEGQARFQEQRIRPGIIRFDLLTGTLGGDGWRIIAHHRDGSLEAAVSSLRRRNLFISFGVLLVLAFTTGMVVIFTHRAQRLARLQMEFVTGVSHELRTPLAVISSAADNLADGIIETKQVARYGTVIKTQAKQLIGLVEQILLFASTKDKRHQYQLRQLSVAEVIEAALCASAGLLQSQGITVEQAYDKNLAPVRGDPNAISQCLQNLINNAVKYRGQENWIKVSAKQDGNEIQISVQDRGQGIAPSELSHIFEPFFRGREVTEAQIHGTGLGLPIAKNIADAMGGRLSVASKVGEGSTFTLHLPVIGETSPATETALPGAAEPHWEHH